MSQFHISLGVAGYGGVTLLTAIALAVSWRILSSLILSPLRGVPGPWLAKVTGQWLIFVDLAGHRTTTIHELHKKYGTIVRIGPTELSFSSIDCVKEIYGQQTVYMKAPIYDTFSVPPLGIFSMRDKREHSERRRLLAHAFSLSNLYDMEPLIRQKVNKLLEYVERHRGDSVNVHLQFRLLALDIVGELFLGKSFGALDSEPPPPFLHDMDQAFLLSGLEGSFPWLYRLLFYLPVPAVHHFITSRERIAQYGKDAFTSYVQRHGRTSRRKDLLTKILVSEFEDKEASMNDLEIYMEISNLVFAGTDTTSTTLTYLFWELTRYPHWQDRLRAELLSSLPQGAPDEVSYRTLMKLPILDALVNESLRLHPAAPASLQRITPAGGRQLGGMYVPETTIVSMQCYTTQRDPSAFPDADTFDPERWLLPGGPNNEMKELFMPFSRGTRACLGMNLALMELKVTTAALIGRYQVSISPMMRVDDMDMTDHFLVLPKGGHCHLIFTPAR